MKTQSESTGRTLKVLTKDELAQVLGGTDYPIKDDPGESGGNWEMGRR